MFNYLIEIYVYNDDGSEQHKITTITDHFDNYHSAYYEAYEEIARIESELVMPFAKLVITRSYNKDS